MKQLKGKKKHKIVKAL